ncbi:MAG: hypothetical protein HYS21_04105 [Deltaproteobacteria bacterium]|nr:hypothetical protein [Deltaproteobacteria bacterium]
MSKYWLAVILGLPAILLVFTLDRYYGYYYDNKFFNLLALKLLEQFKIYFYLGSHYHVPSSIFSYIAYLFMLVLGPGDLAMEAPAAIFHLLTAFACYKLGRHFHGEIFGLVFSVLVGLAPIHLIQIYTIPDLSFAIFLNVGSLYYFLTGLETSSVKRITLGAVLYSVGCFQAIYSLLLLPFYIICSFVFFIAAKNEGKEIGLVKRLFFLISFLFALPAYTYIYLLIKATFLAQNIGGFLFFAMPLAAIPLYIKKRPSGKFLLSVLFLAITTALLSYFDLIVQMDYFYFKHSFGYFIDAYPAGGYGGRPLARFIGQELNIFGIPVYMSVLTSMFEFVGKDFAKTSFFDFTALKHLYFDYFRMSFPAGIRFLFFAGVASMIIELITKIRKSEKLSLFFIYPLIWLVIAAAPFISLGPDYYNIRRIYILPLPYFFAAYGVIGIASLLSYCSRSRYSVSILILILTLATTLEQMKFSRDNIFGKYIADKTSNMYFKLFYGHYYGRSYKEAGEFLLNDAPLKENGHYRAALVYTIPEDSKVGRSLPLFNTIDWYTNNQIKIIFDFKDGSSTNYGSPLKLSGYLERLFYFNPELEVIYFADFVDDKNNFSYFSKVHKNIKPYAIADDDGSEEFDCVFYKFTKQYWKEQLTDDRRMLNLPS